MTRERAPLPAPARRESGRDHERSQTLTCYHARWVVPVAAPPLRDATVAEAGGRIVYVGPRSGAPAGEAHDLGSAVLLPGLVNAHTHLELTAFRGLLEELPFRSWIVRLQGAKVAELTRERALDAARLGIVEGLRAGVTTYADTCDTGVALDAMRELGVRGIMYQEVFGPSPDPMRVRESAESLREKLVELDARTTELVGVGVSPHAPYTVSDPLFALVARSGRPLAIHVAESEAETSLIRDGDGAFAGPLRARGIPVAPRARSPIALLERLGVLGARPLLVHCVQVDDDDLRSIARSRAAIAHCPVSNAKLGHGTAPVCEMLDAGIVVGLGSDSMAANNRMDLLEEARVAVLAQRARTRRPAALAAATALDLATLGGARALGLDHQIGSLEVGKAADLAAFDLPDGLDSADPVAALIFALGGRPARLVTVAGVPRVWDGAVIDFDEGLPGRVAAIGRALERAIGNGEPGTGNGESGTRNGEG